MRCERAKFGGNVKPGAHFGDIGYAIPEICARSGLPALSKNSRHSVGVGFHEELRFSLRQMGCGAENEPVYFYDRTDDQRRRKELTILSNGWTPWTKDKSLSAQWRAYLAGH